MTSREPRASIPFSSNAGYPLFSMSTIRVGVIGCGYWGPNLLRNFAENDGAELRWICDVDNARLAAMARRYPAARTTTDYLDLISDKELGAITVVTPVATHFAIASAALRAGKHVLVEKPLTATAAEAEELIALAEQAGLSLMVDHTFVYTGAVRKMKEIVAGGELGDLLYFDSVRINLGLFQRDINVRLLPVLGLVPFGYQDISTVADRYAYPAMIGPALAVALLAEKLPARIAIAAG